MQKREQRTSIEGGRVQIRRPSEQRTDHDYPVLNISRGGLCFQSSDEFELNEKVVMDVSVNNTPFHHANARICYRNDTDDSTMASYGLSFLDQFIDIDDIRKL